MTGCPGKGVLRVFRRTRLTSVIRICSSQAVPEVEYVRV
jgi:hypothetical protein